MTSESLDVVISRYNESLWWLDSWVGEKASVYVYDKGPSGGLAPARVPCHIADKLIVTELPNVGREAHTYLSHIVEHYHSVADVTIFLQGDPFPHMSLLPGDKTFEDFALDMEGVAVSPVRPNYFLTEESPPSFHLRVDVHGAAKIVIGESLPHYAFNSGAQYAVRRECIQARPRAWWQALLQHVVEDRVNAWEIERLWMYIFYQWGAQTQPDP